MLVYSITGIQDLFPHFTGFMSPAWQVDRTWQLAEPGECRPVILTPILRARLTVAALWGWNNWLAVTMTGLLGMLHPAAFLSLKRQDLVLPRDAMLKQPILYVHLRNPKIARFGRRQHAKVEDSLVVSFLDALYGGVALDQPLFPGSASVYRWQWDRKLWIVWKSLMAELLAERLRLCCEDPELLFSNRRCPARSLERSLDKA